MSDVTNGGGYVGIESVSESLYLLLNFVVNVKLLSLKKKSENRDQNIR